MGSCDDGPGGAGVPRGRSDRGDGHGGQGLVVGRHGGLRGMVPGCICQGKALTVC